MYMYIENRKHFPAEPNCTVDILVYHCFPKTTNCNVISHVFTRKLLCINILKSTVHLHVCTCTSSA